MRVARFFVILFLVIGLGGAALAGCLALLVPAGAQFAKTTDYDALLPEMNKQALRSYVFDVNGGVMTTLFEEDRAPIELASVPQVFIDAVLAIEDRRFYEHDGVDWEGTTRALFENLDAGEIQQGGSTITQQLVKNTMGEPGDRDLKTKAREAVLAKRLENELSKDEILERYINAIYLGNGAYGVQAAAERYFGIRDPKLLTLGQAALLAGLIQAPETLNPITHPDRAARRRVTVLDAMVDMETITAQQARLAREEPLPTTAVSPDRNRDSFTQHIVDLLTPDDGTAIDPDGPAAALGELEADRYNSLFMGGLKIHTSYDPVLQNLAGLAVDAELPESPFVAAMVVIDNATGGVRAMYTGKPFAEGEYNPVTQDGRQTGSAFKAIVLATVLEAGYSPEDTVSGAPLSWRLAPGSVPPTWAPSNCKSGTITLTSAIADSSNCGYARALLSLGPGNFGADGAQRLVDMAAKLGIEPSKLLNENGVAPPSQALGAGNTNLLDMAEAFSVFANEGIHREPTFITKIEGPDGEVLYEADTTGTRALTEQNARTETSMLRHVITDGTATRANIGRPAAGKTGTSNESKDAWFVGYTPQYTAAVWMGNWEVPVPMRIGGSGVVGGRYPAPIWAEFMKAAHENIPVTDFTPPDESLFPARARVDEYGRGEAARAPSRPRSRTTPTTVPGTPPTDVAPAVPDTAPPVTAPPDTALPGPPP